MNKYNPVIICTAGHIDHGKSSLIKALTGTDPDRLKEEKERGITIDLGFAFLNEQIAFIDVPGHEKFVKHMVSGASTVDYAMLIVAADDGVMPQTREHLDILNLLNVKGGLVVITKADLADNDLITLVRDEVTELIKNSVLKNAQILVADSVSGRGIQEVRQAILHIAQKKQISGEKGIFRMPVDRIFTIKGFGTVVTGSVISGSVQTGDRLELLPKQTSVRVKGIQSHGRETSTVIAGQRAALNLANIAVEEINRGDVLVTPDVLKPSNLMYARVKILPSSEIPLTNHQRVHIHIHTANLIARIILLEGNEITAGSEGYIKLYFESKTCAQRMDRFIIRRYSPLITIGGGIILDANPEISYRKKSEILEMLLRLDSSSIEDLILAAITKSPFITPSEIAISLSHSEDEILLVVSDMQLKGDILLFHTNAGQKLCPAILFRTVLENIKKELSRFHQTKPLSLGMSLQELISKIKNLLPSDTAHLLIDRAVEQKLLSVPSSGLICLPDFKVSLTEIQKKQISQIQKILDSAGFNSPSPEEIAKELSLTLKEAETLLTYMTDTYLIVWLPNNVLFSMKCINDARKKLINIFSKSNSVTVSEIKQTFDSSRKYIIPLLEYFDSIGWTIRKEDVRLAGLKLFGY